MSSRAVRKALKRLEAQKESQQELGSVDVVDVDEAESPETTPSNPFALLNEAEESEEEETVVSQDKPISSAKPASTASTPTKKSKNKKKKRKPQKENTPAPETPTETPPTPESFQLDDVDRAIQEISKKYGEVPPSSSTSSTNAKSSHKFSLLSVSLKHLDADVELRKLFGKIVDAEARESRRQPIHGIPARVVNRIKASQVQRKRTLMKPKDEWQLFAAYNTRMLSMDIVGKEGSITKFKFVHSRRYQDIQMQFFITALGGDANVLMELLRENPFHVDSCIQVSEILKHQGSLSEAADLIERALFSLDCGLHPLFNLPLGTTRLPFEYFENRCLYLAVWSHMESLGRRGCWRTALEFNKLLFAMEPEANPYSALLAVDFAAMKCREYQYLIDLRDSSEWIDETGYLLNIHYTAALAEYMLEKDQKRDHTHSSQSLSRAIQRFPWLIAQLFYTLKLKFPPEFPTTVPPSPLQALYTDLYIHRSKDLWSLGEISSWLITITKQIAPEVVEPLPPQTTTSIPLNVARHVYVMNVPALMSHIPREYTSRTQLATDPLPPETSISPYDTSMQSLPGIAQDESALQRWIADLVRGQEDEALQEDEVDEADEEEEEHQETLIAQLTNTLRNVVAWFRTGQQVPQEDDSDNEQDDGYGVD